MSSNLNNQVVPYRGGKQLSSQPKRLYLDRKTYLTKINGEVVMARDRSHRPETAFDIGIDLLGEVFGGLSKNKMKRFAATVEDDSPLTDSVPVPLSTPIGEVPLSAPQTGTSAIPSSAIESQKNTSLTPYPNAPAGIYQYGNRQLVLLPTNSQMATQPTFPPQPMYPYNSTPWMQENPYNQFMGATMGGNWSEVWNGFPYGGPQQWDHQAPANSAHGPETQPVKVTSATIPVCGNCGRIRSRKYQAENPIKSGDTAPVSFCRKCQKDATSSESSESPKSDKKQKKKKTKNKETRRKQTRDSETDKKRKIESKRRSKKKDLETESEDDGETEEFRGRSGQRGRPRIRINIHDVEDNDDILTSPLIDDISRRRPHHGRAGSRSGPQYKERSPSRRGTSLHEQDLFTPKAQHYREDQQSSFRRRRDCEDETPYLERDTHDMGREFRENHIDHHIPDLGYRNAHHVKGRDTHQSSRIFRKTAPTAIYVVEEAESASTRSKESSRRRREERNAYGRTASSSSHRRLSPLSRPLQEDEVIVVEEESYHLPYQPSDTHRRPTTHDRQKAVDKIKLGKSNHSYSVMPEEEASKYYQRDWAREGEIDPPHGQRVRAYDVRDDLHYQEGGRSSSDMPRAPSPPEPSHNEVVVEEWVESTTNSMHEDIDGDRTVPDGSRGARKFRSRSRGRSGSKSTGRHGHKSAYAYKTTKNERALVPSPRRSREHVYVREEMSDLAEAEDGEDRHVSFGEPEIHTLGSDKWTDDDDNKDNSRADRDWRSAENETWETRWA